VSSTKNGEFVTSLENTVTKETKREETDSTTWEISRGIQFTIETNTCVQPVCMPEIQSTVILWLFKPPNLFDKFGKPIVQIVTVEVQMRKSDEKNAQKRDLEPDLNNIQCVTIDGFHAIHKSQRMSQFLVRVLGMIIEMVKESFRIKILPLT
jgi:hypothetical protein